MSEGYQTKDEIEKAFGIEYLSTIEPESQKLLDQIRKKATSPLRLWFQRKHDKWMSSLYGKELKKHKEIAFKVKKVNPLIGYGVFTDQFIPKLGYIGEYAGDLRKRKRKDRGNDYIFGYMVGFFRTPWIIDAKYRGNFTRFINHSFYPNVSSRGFAIDGVYHVIFYANRPIKKGEQLTYDYGPTYWNSSRPYPQEL